MQDVVRILAGQIKVSADQAGVPKASADAIITGGVSLVFGIVGLICVLVIVIAGFRYVISQGDSGAVSKAKNAILYAVIGLVISLFAFSITQFVAAGVLGALPDDAIAMEVQV